MPGHAAFRHSVEEHVDALAPLLGYARVTTEPRDRAAVEAAVRSDADGAVVVFEGVDRVSGPPGC
jgi:hypothetical protein